MDEHNTNPLQEVLQSWLNATDRLQDVASKAPTRLSIDCEERQRH